MKSKYSKISPNPNYGFFYNNFPHRVIFEVVKKHKDEYVCEWLSNGYQDYLSTEIKPEALQWFQENNISLYQSDPLTGSHNLSTAQAGILVRCRPRYAYGQQIVVGFKIKEDAMRFRLSWG